MIVETTGGAVRGCRGATGNLEFRGIPYAAAPVGELRFAAAQPHPGWSGVRDALANGPTPLLPPASETSSIPEPTVPGDEILNLNVFTPDAAGSAPVYVWIHGGSYTAGTPGGPWFDGARFNALGVVVVSISYRLGFEGFGHVPGAPENRAVSDWIAALRWVRANAASFGGDPDRVTIGGQSAGGGAVLTLLAAPPARGLFRAAVAHSAPIPNLTLADAERTAAALARHLDIEPTLAGWRGASRERIVAAEREEARTDLWGALSDLRFALSWRGTPLWFGPVLGTTELPGEILDLIADPAGAVPLLLGSTKQEFNPSTDLLRPALTNVTPTPALTAAGVPGTLARAYPRAYPGLDTPELLGQALTDRVFRIPAVQVASAHAQAAPTWLWDFRWHAEGMRARHCADLPFAWHVLDAERVDRIAGEDPPVALADAFSAAIAAFVRDGDPGWERFTPEQPAAMVYDEPCWVGRDPYRFERLAIEAVPHE